MEGGERFGSHVGDAFSTADVLRINQVGADGLDLIQHVLLARHSNGDHQDQGSRADYHPQGGQRKADFVAAKILVSESKNLANRHSRPQAPGHRTNAHI